MVATCSASHSMLVLWQLPVALHIVRWALRTVVKFPIATYYNCTHANTVRVAMAVCFLAQHATPYSTAQHLCALQHNATQV